MPDLGLNDPPLVIDTHADWKTIAAQTAAALEKAQETAEDLASNIKDLYKEDLSHVQAARSAYDDARHAYNGVAVNIKALLILGKNAPKTPVSTTDAHGLLNKFEGIARPLIEAKTARNAAMLAGFVPSLGDIAKVFDSIMTAIEWFKTRNDKQRHELADLLDYSEIRTWAEAGTPRTKPPKADDTNPAKKDKGGNS